MVNVLIGILMLLLLKLVFDEHLLVDQAETEVWVVLDLLPHLLELVVYDVLLDVVVVDLVVFLDLVVLLGLLEDLIIQCEVL